jgi:hypothetical protein
MNPSAQVGVAFWLWMLIGSISARRRIRPLSAARRVMGVREGAVEEANVRLQQAEGAVDFDCLHPFPLWPTMR